MRQRKIYLVGSLRNPDIRGLAMLLRGQDHDVFDDWHAAGAKADDIWREYELTRGRSFDEALRGAHAQDVFAFDKRNIDACDTVILALPAGRSGHLELGYAVGRGKSTAILLDKEYDRWDIMYNFAEVVVRDMPDLMDWLNS